MRIPAATYRVQFNKDFRFTDALQILDGLHRLGISHLYASPIFASRAGSMHGYDVIDPNCLNPEIGTPEEFESLVAALREREMGLILDIVPNHMAATPENRWWMDVLESGAASKYAGYFGINWGTASDSVEEKIFLPILGGPYGSILDAGELKITYDHGSFFLNYWQTRLPLAPVTYRDVLVPGCGPLLDHPDVHMLFDVLGRLAPRSTSDWDAILRRETEKETIKQRIHALYESLPPFREHLDASLECINGQPGNPDSFEALHHVLENQAYRLAYWRVARDRINYRRFFDISDLIGIRVESDEVFAASHTLISEMLSQGKADGIRIDHIDGLNDPADYLGKLPQDVYTVVEKILVGEERLPVTWPVHGTSGYDFLGYANALFVHLEGFERLSSMYRETIGFTQSLEDVEADRKRLAMRTLFPGEIADLGASLASMAEEDRYARDFNQKDITRALREITACLPVYRTYIRDTHVSDTDRRYLAEAKERAMQRSEEDIDPAIFEYVIRVLLLRFRPHMTDEQKAVWVRFVRRWQQITGPVMAKGVEDSTYYVYNRLVSLNEVGGIPEPVTIAQMHEFLLHRARKWPASMNASSTHDTKRSEDVRARLNVLADMPGEWSRHVRSWRSMMRKRRGPVDQNEEYFIYQNLLGAWPLNQEEVPQYRERFLAYLIKAAREARTWTDWIKPSEEHESALTGFASGLFDDEQFQRSFQAIFERSAWFGALNSLSQLVLKIASPGLPDFYRGTIGWDFSLVDPDNRRPADMAPTVNPEESVAGMLTHWRDGHVKAAVTSAGLAFRKANARLFEKGEYIPLQVQGRRAEHLFAFLRRQEGNWALAVIPLFCARLSIGLRAPVGRTWQDTVIVMPAEAPVEWSCQFTRETLRAIDNVLPASRVLAEFPIALLGTKQ